jgi:dienelactone hydrolase
MPLSFSSGIRRACLLVVFGSFVSLSLAQAEPPRVLPVGQVPQDQRLGKLKDLNGYFPFTPSKTKEEWAARAEQVRRRILVATGLWPMPAKTPANAVVHGKVEQAGYTIERVYLESYPGHFVTGNLYRPVGKPGKLPAVLCPHGHWQNGRFMDSGAEAARKQIAEGAERFENGGRSVLQARCVQLARMGCVVFHYDMVGYADSIQIPFELAHGFAKQRPEFDTPENWGFFSTQAELRQQSILGLQTYNSLRALDWLSELPDVDPARIGVTGASGGVTQTFILCAIDSRPAVAFPAVMVSTAMQGGCTCENCSNLRIGTGNIEFAAMTAPRPLGMTGANDWTKEIATK